MLPPPATRRPNSERVRVASNYARLGVGFVLGLWILRLVVGLGTDAYSVIVLFTAGLGLHVLIREILLAGMTPVLSKAWNHHSPGRFPRVFKAVRNVAWGMAAVGATVYLGLWFSTPWLNIPPALLEAAGVFVLARSVPGVLSIAMSPTLVLYLASGRVAEHNVIAFGDRLSEFLAAVVALTWFATAPAAAVMAYGVVASTLQTVILVAAFVHMQRTASVDISPLRRPAISTTSDTRLERVTRGHVLRSVGENSTMILAIALYIRTDFVLLQVLSGPVATAVLGMAVQLSGYVRVITSGLTLGLESVATRTEAVGSGLTILFQRSLFAQAFVVCPAAVFLGTQADAVVDVMFRSRVDDVSLLPVAAWTLQLLLLSVFARGLTDGWVRLLAGLGHIRDIVRPTVRLAVCNPPIIVLLWAVGVTDLTSAAAISFALSLGMINLGVVPRVAARVTGASILALLKPSLGPGVASVIAIPAITLGSWAGQQLQADWRLLEVGLAAISYGVVYCGLVWWRRPRSVAASASSSPPLSKAA